MKNKKIFPILLVFLILLSCNNKKLTEVVEVPLPTADEKIMIGDPEDIKAVEGTFEIQELGFKYDDLLPNIDPMTMELHYAKHYLAYANALNKAIDTTDYKDLNIEDLLSKIDPKNESLTNKAGGFYNHNLFWQTISNKKVTQPQDSLAAKINQDFGSFSEFKTQFSYAAKTQIGSGWTWLILDSTGKLQITTTTNNQNPLQKNALIKGKPIMVLDMWEHAFYLNYQNKKNLYVDNFFKIINWKKVGQRFDEAIRK